MHSLSAAAEDCVNQKQQGGIDTHLSGRLLVLARTVWVVLVVLSLSMSLLDIHLQFARLHIVCTGSD